MAKDNYTVSVEINFKEEYYFDYETREEAELAKKHFEEFIEATDLLHGGQYNVEIWEN